MTVDLSSNPISFKCLGVLTARAKVSPIASWKPEQICKYQRLMREISLNDYEYDDYEYSVIGSVING